MKKLLLLILLTTSLICNGQNYQCLQAGVKHYFTNGNGYLRGIRIDSVRTMGDTTVYYPFHTPRGVYDPSMPISFATLDQNGGSWLGKRVLQKSDGTFIFDSYWNDSVIIKTQANPGDNWVFYQDTSNLYYKATMLGYDTMTILGTLDSIKTIMITAQNLSGIVTTDPLDSFKIILGKNNGFVQVFDLYTFPYHKPDSVYRSGLDFYLDKSTLKYSNINGSGSTPSHFSTLFSLVAFINPNEQQLHNWDIGDIIESDFEMGTPIIGSVTYTYLQDTISNKVVSGHFINYTVIGSTFNCLSLPLSYPCAIICKSGTYSFSDLVYPIFDTSLMPEGTPYIGGYLFYYPDDTSFCMRTPLYLSVAASVSGLGWVDASISYKLGIGKTNFHHFDGEPTLETDNLLYYSINGISCGTPRPSEVNNINLPSNQFSLFPNPATEEITIKTTTTTPYTITLQNMLGQTLQTTRTTKQEQTLNVTNLPAGVYNVSITDETGSRYNRQVVIIPRP